MPWSRRRPRGNRTRRTRRGRQQYGARLGRAPRWNRRQRVNNNVTRNVLWLKRVQAVTSTPTGTITDRWPTTTVDLYGDFSNYASMWEEFKVLKIVVNLFPANVGGESMQYLGPAPPPAGLPIFQRGDICSWVDQGSNDALPAGIDDVINRSSCRLFQPRRFHKRWMSRPRSFPSWGTLDAAGNIVVADSWVAQIRLYGDNFTPITAQGQQNFFWAQSMIKVLFRGRRE